MNRSGLDLLLDLKDAVGDFIKAGDNADTALNKLTDAFEKCEAYEDEAWARKIDEGAKSAVKFLNNKRAFK